ncbi:neo-calmodulin-like [Mytilus galloprovincialis]|uniref:CALM n=1 Tax=Mytilus edulis TaxID=6550 RepID=A0A8S3PS06_MYTED|nr:CALM [Mytilus edulis]
MTQSCNEDLEALRETFDIFDKNKNGSICATELGTLLRAVGENPTQREIEYFIKSCDKNKNNVIEFEDFVALMEIIRRDATRKEDQEETLKRAFKIFDKDGNGTIDVKELERVTTQLGEVLSEEELAQMFKIADANKDGKIDYKEFTKYITKPISKQPMGHSKKNHNTNKNKT